MSNQETDELPPSKLGTKEYWDSVYQVEITNFNSHGDVGEVWFGEDSALRIVRWLTRSEIVRKDDPVIDLGCGNGMMLIELAEEGFTSLTGVDYSARAVELAKGVAKDKGYDNIIFLTCDIVSDKVLPEKFSIVLDKGTYDAISLNPENASAQREAYKSNVTKLLRPNGLFVIASCNWTLEELKQYFGSAKPFRLRLMAKRYLDLKVDPQEVNMCCVRCGRQGFNCSEFLKRLLRMTPLPYTGKPPAHPWTTYDTRILYSWMNYIWIAPCNAKVNEKASRLLARRVAERRERDVMKQKSASLNLTFKR